MRHLLATFLLIVLSACTGAVVDSESTDTASDELGGVCWTSAQCGPWEICANQPLCGNVPACEDNTILCGCQCVAACTAASCDADQECSAGGCCAPRACTNARECHTPGDRCIDGYCARQGTCTFPPF